MAPENDNDPDKDKDPEDGDGCRKCGKVCVILSNVIFGIIGAAILTAGVLLMTNTNIWGDSMSTGTGSALDTIPKLSGWANISGNGTEPTGGLSVDFSVLTSELNYALIGIGGFLLLMAILGCAIFCCDDIISAVLYGILLSIAIVAQIAVLVIFSTGVMNPTIKDKVNSTLTTGFVAVDNYKGTSVTWNFVMLQMQCCGVDSYEDFTYSTSWWNIRQFTTMFNGSDFVYPDRLVTPLACCKLNGDFVNATDFEGGRLGATPLCAKAPTNSTSNYEKGCWNAVSDLLSDYKIYIIAATAALIAIQLILMIVTLVLFCNSARKKEDEEDIKNKD